MEEQVRLVNQLNRIAAALVPLQQLRFAAFIWEYH
jgi:hypothetical protein